VSIHQDKIIYFEWNLAVNAEMGKVLKIYFFKLWCHRPTDLCKICETLLTVQGGTTYSNLSEIGR